MEPSALKDILAAALGEQSSEIVFSFAGSGRLRRQLQGLVQLTVRVYATNEAAATAVASEADRWAADPAAASAELVWPIAAVTTATINTVFITRPPPNMPSHASPPTSHPDGPPPNMPSAFTSPPMPHPNEGEGVPPADAEAQTAKAGGATGAILGAAIAVVFVGGAILVMWCLRRGCAEKPPPPPPGYPLAEANDKPVAKPQRKQRGTPPPPPGYSLAEANDKLRSEAATEATRHDVCRHRHDKQLRRRGGEFTKHVQFAGELVQDCTTCTRCVASPSSTLRGAGARDDKDLTSSHHRHAVYILDWLHENCVWWTAKDGRRSDARVCGCGDEHRAGARRRLKSCK